MFMIFEDKIKKVLDEIRPGLQADGGDLEFVEADEKSGVVKIKLVGRCQGCPMAEMTLKFSIEQTLREKVEGVKEVIKID